MRSIFVILSSVVLSGCFYQATNQSDIQTAIKACGSLETIVEIQSYFIGNEWVKCANRSDMMLNQDVWRQK